MKTARSPLDTLALALALALVAWPAIVFVSERNGAASIMCAMCLGGLVVGRLAGVPGRVLLPVAFGLMLVLWMVWIDPPASPRRTSALAHACGGALVGWGLAEALRHRIRDPLAIALLSIFAVIALTVVWELGEFVGDRLFDTALIPRKRDSAEDIFFGTAGGLVGIGVAWLTGLWWGARTFTGSRS